MDKLIALPIPGESFLLRRQGKNILVDGGHGSLALSTALSSNAVAVAHLDIVVCTHADKDHAGGLVELLDNSNIKIGEFWLPGTWTESLPELIQSPGRIVDGLVHELDIFPSDYLSGIDHLNKEAVEAAVNKRVCDERSRLRNDQLLPESVHESQNNENFNGLIWLKSQLSDSMDLDKKDTVAKQAFNRGRGQVRARASRKSVGYGLMSLWLDLINTAERIRKIAMQAIRHNVQVRWFDFSKFSITKIAIGGEACLLVPLNSVELHKPPRQGTVLSYLSKLTPVNEECLVFFSPPLKSSDDSLGVVFTGDSPLGEGSGYRMPFLHKINSHHFRVVATAPHHGSENNMMAYSHLQKWAQVVLWLRAGGTTKHPGLTYRSLPSAQRACTHCPHQDIKRRLTDVQLSNDFYPWLLRVSSHECCCT